MSYYQKLQDKSLTSHPMKCCLRQPSEGLLPICNHTPAYISQGLKVYTCKKDEYMNHWQIGSMRKRSYVFEKLSITLLRWQNTSYIIGNVSSSVNVVGELSTLDIVILLKWWHDCRVGWLAKFVNQFCEKIITGVFFSFSQKN